MGRSGVISHFVRLVPAIFISKFEYESECESECESEYETVEPMVRAVWGHRTGTLHDL